MPSFPPALGSLDKMSFLLETSFFTSTQLFSGTQSGLSEGVNDCQS